MPAPKGRTNAPSRKLSCWVAPYQEEWVRRVAQERYPDSEPRGSHSAVSRLLRSLVEREMERDTE